jgi:hypothetical protein
MKVFVLAVSNSEGCCRPDVYSSREKALQGLKEAYEQEIEEWVDENGKLIEYEYGNPIQDYNINLEKGWAYVVYSDFEVNFEIYEEEVK